jgi:hypothetical protein
MPVLASMTMAVAKPTMAHRPLFSSMSVSSIFCSADTCLGVMLISGSSMEFITTGVSFIVATVSRNSCARMVPSPSAFIAAFHEGQEHMIYNVIDADFEL